MSIVINTDFIKKHTRNKTDTCYAITKSQCELINLKWEDLEKGWLSGFEEIEVSNARAELFKRLHGVVGKKNQQLVINEFKKEIG